MIDGPEALERFDRAYATRLAAGNKISVGWGVWVSLYDKDDTVAPLHVVGGADLSDPIIAKMPLKADDLGDAVDEADIMQ